MNRSELIEAARIGIAGRYADVARALGVSPQFVSEARHGRKKLTDEQVITLATLAELDAAATLAAIAADQASDKAKEIWSDAARRLGAKIIVAGMMAPLIALPAKSTQQNQWVTGNSGSVYYVKSCRRRRRGRIARGINALRGFLGMRERRAFPIHGS